MSSLVTDCDGPSGAAVGAPQVQSLRGHSTGGRYRNLRLDPLALFPPVGGASPVHALA
jgi:hypothetical protein